MDPMMDPMATMDPMAAGMPPPPLPAPAPPVQYGPAPKPWFKKPPRPKLERVLDDAEQQKDNHEEWLATVRFFADILSQEIKGIFERDRQKVESGEIVPLPMNDIRSEHERYCSWIAGMTIGVTAKARETFDREESAAKEDFCYALLARWELREQEAMHGTVARGTPDAFGRTGVAATYIAPDFTDEELGLDVRQIDPATVFPVVEGRRGIAKVYRVYEAAAGDVIGNFGTDDGAVEAKVRKIAKGDDGRYDQDHRAEVVEYWDRHWGMVAYDEKPIRTWEHGYGKVPFVVTPGCFGLAGFLGIPDGDAPLERADILRGTAISSSRGNHIARTREPFLWRQVPSHLTEEAVGSHLLTALRRSINPPMVAKQGVMSAQEGTPQVNTDEGGMTAIRDDDAIEALPNLPAPEALTPLMLMVGQNGQMGRAPGLLMGQNPSAQTSGSAMDILAQGGFEAWTPLVFGTQAHYTAVFTRGLEIVRDWGDLFGPEGERGAVFVARRNPPLAPGRISPMHRITADLIRRTGTAVAVELHKFNPHSLAAVGTGLTIAKSMGVVDKRTILKVLGITGDPEGVLARVERELLDEVPEIMQTRHFHILKREAELALAQGDEESAEHAVMQMRYLAEQMQLAMIAKLSMMPGMGASAGGGPAAPPATGDPELDPNGMPLEPGQPGMPVEMGQQPPPGVPPPQEAPTSNNGSLALAGGLSLPGMGMPPGTEGGRPPGLG